MAKQYGGKFSPDGSVAPGAEERPAWHGKRPSRVGARVNLLFYAPLPLAISAFFQKSTDLILTLVALGMLLGAAWMTREGLLAQEAYEARKVSRRPALPRKIFGSVLIGGGIALASVAKDGPIVMAVLLGLAGMALHLFAFGLDPLRNKGMEGIDTFQQDRVAKAVEGAEKALEEMRTAILRAGDRKMEMRVEQFATTARDMFRTIEEDPRDLTSARKYLGVYLMGARDATSKFADIYARSRNPQARADYAALLDDLESNFAARTEKFLLDNHTDLTVEIDVLRERLEREGVRTE